MNTFFTADTHFGHAGVCKFLRDDGTKLRPWDDPDEMDEDLVKYWNETVKPNDKVYHLGDVVINRKALKTMARLNGDKILIKGNHDIFKLEDYTPYFRDIRAYAVLDNILCSHIPVHPDSKGRFRANVHGHLHSNIVCKPDVYRGGKPVRDPWYVCVSVEHTNFRPISFEDVKKQLEVV